MESPTNVLSIEPWDGPILDWLDEACAQEAQRIQEHYQLGLDEFKGILVSDAQIEALLGSHDRRVSPVEPNDAFWAAVQRSPFERILSGFHLTNPQAMAMIVVAGPELDLRYQTVYSYLNNDATKKFPTADLVHRLCGTPLSDIRTLVDKGLATAVDQGATDPWAARPLTVREPVRGFLLGSPARQVPTVIARQSVISEVEKLDRSSGRFSSVVILRYDDRADALGFINGVAQTQGVHFISPETPPSDRLDQWCIDCKTTQLLHRCGLFIEFNESGSTTLVGATSAALEGCPFPIVLAVPADLTLPSHLGGMTVSLPPTNIADRMHSWKSELLRHGHSVNDEDIRSVARHFRLSPTAIGHSAQKLEHGKSVGRAELFDAARGSTPNGLGTLAKKLTVNLSINDLVLPPATMSRLRELADAILNRFDVFDQWGFAQNGETASLRALFSGPSGTGKSLSAAILGQQTGLDVYRVDLASLVSKYIGETEKNIDNVFRAAERCNAILFLDECEAILGKRSEQKDAHDRYANIETAYLLQRMEDHDGVLVLATNIRRNIDDAFARRIHLEIEFPAPDRESREALWRNAIPAAAPCAEIDYTFLAGQFKLTGGEIRNLALSAAFLARQAGTPIGMEHIVNCLARHGTKQGKLPSPGEFREYFGLVEAARKSGSN